MDCDGGEPKSGQHGGGGLERSSMAMGSGSGEHGGIYSSKARSEGTRIALEAIPTDALARLQTRPAPRQHRQTNIRPPQPLPGMEGVGAPSQGPRKRVARDNPPGANTATAPASTSQQTSHFSTQSRVTTVMLPIVHLLPYRRRFLNDGGYVGQ